MSKALGIICAILVLSNIAFAQNLIDHITTLYPSGYGKLALDGDTLYLNTLNGHGVERYNVADPANPTFIDREEVSGFDQIDFNRRVMAKESTTQLTLISFSSFNNAIITASISVSGVLKWKLDGNYLFIISTDDSIRTYNVNNIESPILVTSIPLHRGAGSIPSSIAFGNSICNICYGPSMDIYDISMPENIIFRNSISLNPYGSNEINEANGDTLALRIWTVMLSSYLDFYRFDTDGSMHYIREYGESYNISMPAQCSKNGFIYLGRTRYYVNSYQGMSLLGGVTVANPDEYSINFDIFNNQYFIYDFDNDLKIYNATYSDSMMPEVYSNILPHYGTLSTAAYGNYILSGAESNGGELLIHELDDSNHLSLISTAPNIEAKSIIVAGSSAICLCPDKISQVNLANPYAPVLGFELTGFSEELKDFAKYDTLLFAITDRAYYVIDYDSLAGMTILSRMDFPTGSLTSIGQYLTESVLLEGNLGHIVKISAANPILPVIEQDWSLPPDTLQNLEIINGTVWVSGRHGTRIVNIEMLDSLAFLGPEYFSDVHQIHSSGDTLYVADGANGIRVFTFNGAPYNNLRYIGGYSTGNVANQVCKIGNNFFVSDYYSLQHLRWGAATEIDGPENGIRPKEYTLMQNYPNPFNAQTTIRYTLPSDENATLSIFDIAGREVRQLNISGIKHEIIWDSANSSGQPVASGIYFYAIDGHTKNARKMLLLR